MLGLNEELLVFPPAGIFESLIPSSISESRKLSVKSLGANGW